jgi:hypothetical protein
MAERHELIAWAEKWLGEREVPHEFLQLAAVQNARLRGGADASALEDARPIEVSDEEGVKFLGYMRDSTDPLDYLDVRIIGPESTTWNDGLAQAVLDDEANAESPEFAKLLSYFLPAAQQGGNFVYGYWVYPGECWPPPIVCVDTEGTLFTVRGRTLAEALLADCGDEAEFRLLAQWFTNLGVFVAARTAADIPTPIVRMNPEALESQLKT